MFATLATTALLAAGSASARTASAASDTITVPFRQRTLSQVEASGSASHTPYGSYSSTSDDQHTKRHTTKSSSVTCKSSASSSGFSAARSAHISAVTDAIVYGCSHEIDVYWAKEIEKKFYDGAGYAVAAVWADAKAECEGTGNVYGCAGAYAVAKRWAKASVSAYAEAYALALNGCECNKKDQIADSYAYGSAYEMEDLVAKVSAVADANVCIEGTGSASAHVESHCVQEIYANVWAKSISAALIKGDCYKGLNSDAYIKAEAVIEKWEYVDCASNAYSYY